MSEDTPPCVGLVGVGLMGTALAERALAAGFEVAGYDIDPERCRALEDLGGTAPGDAAAVAARCRWLVFSLMTTADVAACLEACGEALVGREAWIVDTSTGEPREMADLARKWAGRGVGYVDATVAGNSEETRRGEVMALVGGQPRAVDACRPFLDCFARRVHHLGEAGAGGRMKLVFNLVLGLHRAVLAEAIAYAERLDIDPRVVLEILREGTTASHVMVNKGDRMIDRDYSPQARLGQHRKDVRMILALGGARGARLPLTEAHERLLDELLDAGCAGLDNSVIIEAFRSCDPEVGAADPNFSSPAGAKRP